jgi:hypothetical protein
MKTARDLAIAAGKLRDRGYEVEFCTSIDAPDSVDGFSIKHGRKPSIVWHSGGGSRVLAA